MNDKIGVIKDSLQDARSGKLIFLSHCLLNQNACVRGLAGQPAVIRELVDLLLDHDVAFYQMPCPEVTYLGSMRWGQVKRQYGNPMFRRHCRRIAEQVCDQIQTYRDNDHRVIGIVLRDGSPTCGLNTTAVEADEQQTWGGHGLERQSVATLCPHRRSLFGRVVGRDRGTQGIRGRTLQSARGCGSRLNSGCPE